MPVVFISYAHENPQFRESVRSLADWLSQRGCTVLTDHPYEIRPPAEGWQAWMLGCIRKAATVLVVCTPRLKARYEKTESRDTGRGATYEGAIVTQHIYDEAMRNTKFYPVLPDGGNEADIPTTLRPWWNGHFFPSGNEGIRKLVCGETSDAGIPQTDPNPEDASVMMKPKYSRAPHHHRWATDLLEVEGAAVLRKAIIDELQDRFSVTPEPTTAAEVVRFFSNCDSADVQQLFWLVRRALLKLPDAEDSKHSRRQSEEAAAALYCIAAVRLVNQAVLTDGGSPDTPVFSVPCSENAVCAIIATALFGGKLRWAPALESDLPQPEYVFEVKVPAAGDDFVGSFERAVYVILCGNGRKATEIALDSRPLNVQELNELAVKLGTIREVKQECLALVVNSCVDPAVARSFARQHFVPVMFPGNEATSALLGMDAGRLLAEIREFWRELRVLPQGERPAREQTVHREQEGVSHVTKPDINIQVTGGNANIAVTAERHSIAQSGSGNAAHVAHHAGTELSELAPLLRDLSEAIADLSSAEARESLIVQAQAAEAEVSAKGEPDVGLIKGTLDHIKSAATVLDGGEKVLALCNKAYKILAPVLGLPNLPLP